MQRVFAAFCVMIGIVAASWAYAATSAANDIDALASHPLVGSWLVTDSSGLAPTARMLMTFNADGTAIATDERGTTWQGSWKATGERTAGYTFLSLTPSMKNMGQAEVESGDMTWIRSSSIINGDKIKAERIVPEGTTTLSAGGTPEQ
jgi:hypothetical protein